MTSARGLLARIGGNWGAAAQLAVEGGVSPWPQAAFGLEGAVLVPFRIGGSSNYSDLVLQAVPTVWLQFGDLETWGFLKMGTGLAGLYRGGSFELSWIVIGGAGFAVAPRELSIYFGFDATGELDLTGPPLRSIGLGGFVGVRL